MKFTTTIRVNGNHRRGDVSISVRLVTHSGLKIQPKQLENYFGLVRFHILFDLTQVFNSVRVQIVDFGLQYGLG